ncbi:hypothetical protein [Methylobacterium bullatum]|uniref:hypothetical protein n=1 Tax=Methylobacterium bullatum TaxID=570505 RepID=UPI0030CA6176
MAERAKMETTVAGTETETSALNTMDRLIARAEERHVAQVAYLRGLVARGERITEAMRALVEIEDELVRLNDERLSLMPDVVSAAGVAAEST